MIAKHVHHISFAVRELERSRDFYEGVLGLEPIERPDLGLPGLWYQAGGTEVHLIQAPDGVDAGRPPAKLSPLANHQAFAVEDYRVTLETLRGHGLEVLETGAERGQMWVADPDGYVIELIAPPRRA